MLQNKNERIAVDFYKEFGILLITGNIDKKYIII